MASVQASTEGFMARIMLTSMERLSPRGLEAPAPPPIMLMMGARFSSITVVNLPLPSAFTVDLFSFLKQLVVDRLRKAVPRAATVVNFFMR